MAKRQPADFVPRAEVRRKNCLHGIEKLTKKIKDAPSDPRVPAWKQRIAEYEVTVNASELTIDSGKWVDPREGLE